MRKQGVGLAMSGGGFRATLFHLGSLWRLNELGWLKRFSEVTSVSGGSITAGVLGLHWQRLRFNSTQVALNFNDEIVAPLRDFCKHTIDIPSVLTGWLSPFAHPGDYIADHYRKHLFGKATLQDLPDDSEGPRFTFYATSLQSGVSVRFSRPYLADYRVGMVRKPNLDLGTTIAASSAFPPVLCPVTVEMDPDTWEPTEGADLFPNRKLRSVLLLGDGGIYDNLGLERLWDRYTTVLVSDAGAPCEIVEDSVLLRGSEISRTLRALDIITEQTRALRKRTLVAGYKAREFGGAYWGIATRIGDYPLVELGRPAALVADTAKTAAIAQIRTRLNKFSDEEQKTLINWGYALVDAALRCHVLPADVAVGALPYPEQPL